VLKSHQANRQRLGEQRAQDGSSRQGCRTCRRRAAAIFFWPTQ